MSPFLEVDHTADWALRVWAATLPELFVDAARGMYALAGVSAEARPRERGELQVRRVGVEGGDYESLLVSWLQELLYHTESEGLAFFEFRIEALEPGRLAAAAWGAPGDRLEKVIKAVTYHDLNIRETPEGLEATIVFDV